MKPSISFPGASMAMASAALFGASTPLAKLLLGGGIDAWLLAGLLYRAHKGSLTKAAFLSAQNDAIANVAIILAGVATAFTRSFWPDVVVGLGIAAMNIDAARAVWTTATGEHRTANEAR